MKRAARGNTVEHRECCKVAGDGGARLLGSTWHRRGTEPLGGRKYASTVHSQLIGLAKALLIPSGPELTGVASAETKPFVIPSDENGTPPPLRSCIRKLTSLWHRHFGSLRPVPLARGNFPYFDRQSRVTGSRRPSNRVRYYAVRATPSDSSSRAWGIPPVACCRTISAAWTKPGSPGAQVSMAPGGFARGAGLPCRMSCPCGCAERRWLQWAGLRHVAPTAHHGHPYV